MKARIAVFLVAVLALVACSRNDVSDPADSAGIQAPVETKDGPLRYDEVTFLTTHNAFAYFDWDETFPEHGACVNQHISVAEQLEYGVRAFMLDIHWWQEPGTDWKAADERTSPCGGTPEKARIGDWRIWNCHGDPTLGIDPCLQLIFATFEEELANIAEFMAENPDEIITLFLEDYVKDESRVLAAFEAALFPDGLTSLRDVMYDPNGTDWNVASEGGWPTLEWMSQENRTLVVFSDVKPDEAQYTEIPLAEDYLHQNGYDSIELGDMDCHNGEFGPEDEGKLLIMNHFAGPKMLNGWPCPGLSTDVSPLDINDVDFILGRYDSSCAALFGHPPNFLAVDFVNSAPVGETLCDVTGLYYDGPLDAVSRWNDVDWPSHLGGALE